MLVKSYVKLRYWFYPLGNTPAVNLLRDKYSPHHDTLKILCIACGDLRNILFTLWADQEATGRQYKFTVCDSEPAILARNILLLSFFIPDTGLKLNQPEVNVLWDLYYHLFVTSQAQIALRSQINKLLSVSQSLQSWYQSPYGRYLSFLDGNTLAEVREFWQLYGSESDHLRKSYYEGIEEAIVQNGVSTGKSSLNGTRATGIHALSSATIMSDAFRGYWKTGVAAGNQADSAALRRDDGGHINPLFAYSSAALGGFAVHYGTDPLFGFHLAEVFDEVHAPTETLDRLAQVARLQFDAWCRCFALCIQKDNVRIFFHCGEAIGLCYGLQDILRKPVCFSKASYSYLRPWSSRIMRLEESGGREAPGPYDVIDCSNLSDHVGILNLLPATASLLNADSHSILYMETLLRASENMMDYFEQLFRTDIGSLSIVSGLVPVSSVLGTSFEHYGSEVILQCLGDRKTNGQSQWRVRIAWQKASYGDGKVISLSQQKVPFITVDPLEMASLFVKWYIDIFSTFEDLTTKLSTLRSGFAQPLSHDLDHYSRITLVSLLGLAKQNLRTNWSKCIRAFLDGVEHDRSLIVGSNSLQELNVLLHLSGLYTVPALDADPYTIAKQITSGVQFSPPAALAGQSDLPSVVYLTLIVPRQKLQVFKSADLDRIGTPGLHLAVYNETTFENSFFAIHTCFGELSMGSDTSTATVKEDTLGWRGLHSDLIVTAAVPTFQFLISRSTDTHVALAVNASPASRYFLPLLGIHMRVYSTSVANHKALRLLRAPPGMAVNRSFPAPATDNESSPTEPSLWVAAQDGRLENFHMRTTLVQNGEREELSRGCTVDISQTSPCTITIRLGRCERIVDYPWPVNGLRCKARVSRKNFWVETIAPLSLATQDNGYTLTPFPVVLHGGSPIAWGSARVNLDLQPVMPRHGPNTALNAFLAMTLSQMERDVQKEACSPVTNVRTLLDLKQSIATLILGFRGDPDTSTGAMKKAEVFRLAQNGDSDILIFAAALRHDRDLGSLCLDAYAVPLTGNRVQGMAKPLMSLVKKQSLLSMEISASEEVLWKRMLPYCVERCRTTWEHRSTCEYGANPFRCPRSLSHGQMAICTCGEGKDVQGMPKAYLQFARYATRVAISPISAVPYVEPTAFKAALTREADLTAHGLETCHHCLLAAVDLKSCGNCGRVRYCSRECQKAAWKEHKGDCKGRSS